MVKKIKHKKKKQIEVIADLPRLIFGDGYLAKVFGAYYDKDDFAVMTIEPSYPLAEKYNLKLNINRILTIKIPRKDLIYLSDNNTFICRKNILGEQTMMDFKLKTNGY
jgi:hypothetical protein